MPKPFSAFGDGDGARLSLMPRFRPNSKNGAPVILRLLCGDASRLFLLPLIKPNSRNGLPAMPRPLFGDGAGRGAQRRFGMRKVRRKILRGVGDIVSYDW